jgi:hypothetical protein
MTDNKSLLSGRALISIISFPVVLIFAILNLKDINFVFPPFEQLSIANGVIGFTHPTPYFKGTPPFYHLYLDLDDGKKRKWFDDGLSSDSKEQINQYRGKKGKIWWYRTHSGGFGQKFLQLEVDGKMVITYETRKSEYLASKKSLQNAFFISVAIWLFSLFIVDKVKVQNSHV